VLEEANRRTAKEAKQVSMAEKRSLGPVKKSVEVKTARFTANPFAALNSDSDDEKVTKTTVVKKPKAVPDFPQLAPVESAKPQASKAVDPKPVFSYANALSTVASVKPIVESPKISSNLTVMDAAWANATTKSVAKVDTKKKTFWADAESDDEDEDEDVRQEKSSAAFAYHERIEQFAQWEEDNSAW